MGGWPSVTDDVTNRGVLSPWGETPAGDMLVLSGATVGGSGVWTANRIVYMPVVVRRQATVTDFAVFVQTQAGNLDVGIYTFDGTRIVASGSTAVATAGVQVVAMTDTTLAPGWYFVALGCDSSTAAFGNNISLLAGVLRVCGFQEQAGTFPLPATATFATYATAHAPLIAPTYSAVI